MKTARETARQSVARAAIYAMIDDHQGNAIFDDGILDETGTDTEKLGEVFKEMKQALMELGLAEDDDDLKEFIRCANIEIEVIAEGKEEEAE